MCKMHIEIWRKNDIYDMPKQNARAKGSGVYNYVKEIRTTKLYIV